MTEDYAAPDWRGLCEELTEHLSLLDEPPHELVCRAQEALAQPEPEVVGPTDEELWQVGDEDFRANTWLVDAIRYARAVLAHYGHPTPVPVPVAERLPGPEDCDAEGRCWVHQPHEACPESPAWELMLAKYASPNYEAVCWLPATALPLPQGEVEA